MTLAELREFVTIAEKYAAQNGVDPANLPVKAITKRGAIKFIDQGAPTGGVLGCPCLMLGK